jgi:hypothetical protein
MWQILLCAMGHYGEFGCAMGHCGGFVSALWATARNEAVRTVKSVLISALWAIAQDLVMLMGHIAGFGYPLGLVIRWVWLSAMGRSEGFG